MLPSNSLLAQSRKADQWEDEIVPKGRYIFRWGMQEGQKFEFKLSQKIVTETKGGLVNTGELPVQWAMTQQWDVESRDKDVVTILQTMRSVSARFTQPVLGEVHADTNQPAPDSQIAKQLHADLSKLVGQQTRMKIDKLGNIKSFEVVNAAQAGIASGAAANFGPAQLKRVFSQIAIFKTLTYKPGDSWENKHSIKTPQMNAQLDINYEFEAVSDGSPTIATVKLEPKLTLLDEAGPVSVLAQEGSGELKYSMDQMVILESNLHQELELEIKTKDNDSPPLNQKITTDLDIEFNLLNESGDGDSTSGNSSGSVADKDQPVDAGKE